MICPRCGTAPRDDAKFCTACGHPLHGSDIPLSEPLRPPRFLAGVDNMLASGAWSEEFDQLLTVLRPRLTDAWGVELVFDNGLCAQVNEMRHKGDKGLFVEFTLFFDAEGNVIKPLVQEFIRWRPTLIGKWRRVPVPPRDPELPALLNAMGCANYFNSTPSPVAYQRKRPEPEGRAPAWAVVFATRWRPHTLDPTVLLAHLDEIARVLASALSAEMTTAGAAG